MADMGNPFIDFDPNPQLFRDPRRPLESVPTFPGLLELPDASAVGKCSSLVIGVYFDPTAHVASLLRLDCYVDGRVKFNLDRFSTLAMTVLAFWGPQ